MFRIGTLGKNSNRALMILTCPDCATRYSVKDDAIGPNGRTVRCSSCSATWFVSSDADALALKDNLSDDISVIPARTSRETVASGTIIEKPLTDSEHVTRSEPVLGAHVHIRDKADRQKRNRRLLGVAMIWIVTLSILAAAAAIGYFFRQPIVDKYPGMSSAYNLLNVPVKVGGLDFEDPSTSHTIIDGTTVLVINGVIINRSDKTQPLPMVQLSLVNGNGEKITEWMVEMKQSQIGAKQRLTYVSQFPNPPLDAQELKYKFVDPAEAQIASAAPSL